MPTIQQMQRAYQAAARPAPRRPVAAQPPHVGQPGPGGGIGTPVRKPAPAPASAAVKPALVAGGSTITDAPIPGVSAYGEVMARAQDAYNQALVNTRANRTRTLGSLGFDENGAVQGQNLYGSYQQNRRTGALQQEAITNQGANRGLGNFGGLADQQRQDANFATGAGLAGVLGQAADTNTQANLDIQSANQTLQERLAQAQLEAARTNIEGRNFTTAPEPAAAAATASPTASAGIKWAGKTVTTRSQMTSILGKSGVSFAAWAKAHPAAAATLK